MAPEKSRTSPPAAEVRALVGPPAGAIHLEQSDEDGDEGEGAQEGDRFEHEGSGLNTFAYNNLIDRSRQGALAQQRGHRLGRFLP